MSENQARTRGIPPGNTIAVVGDPGTGKTSILLTYFHLGNRGENGDGLILSPQGQQNPEPLEAINGLVSPGERDGDEPVLPNEPFLRCFVSLETSFDRMLQNSPILRSISKCSSNTKKDDVYVFVDATAFLSGRLEDRLRYPYLEDSNPSQEYDNWQRTALHLGGHYAGHHNVQDTKTFGLYWQDDGHEPQRIEQLTMPNEACQNANSPTGNAHPFWKPKKRGITTYRFYDLLTPYLSNPLERVRLLKDLLATLFDRFRCCKNYVVVIDSLDALTSRLEGIDSEGGSETRRLHILNLVRWLEGYNVTTFLACEASNRADQTLVKQPLFLDTESRYLVSGVIQLNYHRYPSGDLARYLRVLKMRGASHNMRPQGYGLGSGGIEWMVPMHGEEQGGARQ